MPLAEEPEIIPKPSRNALTPVTPRPGQRPDGAFKNSVVDVRKRSVDTLLVHVEGSSWETTYYRQLLTSDMEPTSFQNLQNIPYQQYEKINNYIFKVTSPLASSQNQETHMFTVTGSAVIAIAIIPNVGDVFYADIGDGRYGLFSIERTVRKTILKDSVYEVDYTLIDYRNDENSSLIEERIVRELFFSKDHIGSGRGPLVTSKELHDYRSISNRIDEMFNYHIDMFFDEEDSTLLVPDEKRLYDPYFSIFWDKILPRDIYDLNRIPLTIHAGDEYLDYKTIWDSILERNHFSKRIRKGVKIETASSRLEYLIFDGIALTSIDDVITVDEDFVYPSPNIVTINENSIDIADRLSEFHSISKTGFYVLSENYYFRNYEKLSKLELLVLNYLNSKPLNLDHYLLLLDKIKNYDLLEQFYFIPILISLGIDYLRRSS